MTTELGQLVGDQETYRAGSYDQDVGTLGKLSSGRCHLWKGTVGGTHREAPWLEPNTTVIRRRI